MSWIFVLTWQKLQELHQKYGCAVRIAPNEVSISDFNVYRDIYNAKASTKEQSFYRAVRLNGYDHLFTFRYDLSDEVASHD